MGSWLGSHVVEFTLTKALHNHVVCSCNNTVSDDPDFSCDNKNCTKDGDDGAGFKYTVPSDVETTTAYRCSVKVNTKDGDDGDAAEDKKMIYVQFIGEFRFRILVQ